MTSMRAGLPVRRTTLQGTALVFGGLFLLLGILGFVPGVTSHYDEMTVAGHGSGALLLGLFNVSVLLNLLHLAFGVAGVLMARTVARARAYLLGGGLIYLVLWCYGFIIERNHDDSANVIPINAADNWLHLAMGAGMLVLGVPLARRAAGRPKASPGLTGPRVGAG